MPRCAPATARGCVAAGGPLSRGCARPYRMWAGQRRVAGVRWAHGGGEEANACVSSQTRRSSHSRVRFLNSEGPHPHHLLPPACVCVLCRPCSGHSAPQSATPEARECVITFRDGTDQPHSNTPASTTHELPLRQPAGRALPRRQRGPGGGRPVLARRQPGGDGELRGAAARGGGRCCRLGGTARPAPEHAHTRSHLHYATMGRVVCRSTLTRPRGGRRQRFYACGRKRQRCSPTLTSSFSPSPPQVDLVASTSSTLPHEAREQVRMRRERGVERFLFTHS